MVSISAPERRAALTAFSSFLAAALGAFLRITTGSQSCEIGPPPDIFFPLLINNNIFLSIYWLGDFICCCVSLSLVFRTLASASHYIRRGGAIQKEK